MNEIKAPRFVIGDKVYIYEDGSVVLKTVMRVKILISEDGCKSSYQFKENKYPTYSFDYYLNEREVFATKEEILTR